MQLKHYKDKNSFFYLLFIISKDVLLSSLCQTFNKINHFLTLEIQTLQYIGKMIRHINEKIYIVCGVQEDIDLCSNKYPSYFSSL